MAANKLTKICPKCTTQKPVTEFYRNKTRRDGVSVYCKPCFGFVIRQRKRRCSIEGCSKAHEARGYCSKHWLRWRKYGDPLCVMRNNGVGDTVEARFWSRAALTANDQRCWLWVGRKNNKGYGQLSVQGKNWLAHRYAWYLTKGFEPMLFLLHSCDTPTCINPNHLREGTQLENMQDAVKRGRIARGSRLCQLRNLARESRHGL